MAILNLRIPSAERRLQTIGFALYGNRLGAAGDRDIIGSMLERRLGRIVDQEVKAGLADFAMAPLSEPVPANVSR